MINVKHLEQYLITVSNYYHFEPERDFKCKVRWVTGCCTMEKAYRSFGN